MHMEFNTIVLSKRMTELAERYRLNPDWLKKILYYQGQGMTHQEIAEEVGIHRITVQNYLRTVGFMDKEDRRALFVGAAILLGGVALAAWLSRKKSK